MAFADIKSKVDNMGEGELYFLIDELEGTAQNCQFGYLSQIKKELAIMANVKAYAIGRLDSVVGFASSDEYKQWYDWWNLWHYNMSEEKWGAVAKKLDQGECTDRPQGTWRAE